VSIAFKNDSYISDQVVPIIPVTNETDRYATFSQADFARREVNKMADGQPAPQSGFAVSYGTYAVDEYAIAMKLGPRTLANADSAFRLETSAAEWVADQLALEREYRVASAIFSATNFTNTAAVTTQWNQTTLADPIGDIMGAMDKVEDQATGRSANTVVMGIQCWRQLARCATVFDYLFGGGVTRPQVVTPRLFEEYLSGYVARPVKILVGKAFYNTVKEGGTASYSPIWGKNCWVGYVPETASVMTPAAAYIFRAGYQMRKWNETSSLSTIVEGRELYAIEIVSAACAYYLTSCVA
jgi:hypothetical protein